MCRVNNNAVQLFIIYVPSQQPQGHDDNNNNNNNNNNKPCGG
jgi:hypothetical protein